MNNHFRCSIISFAFSRGKTRTFYSTLCFINTVSHKMQPLPLDPLRELKQPTIERVCMWIPLLGWCFGAALQRKRFRPVVQLYEQILSDRNHQLVIEAWQEEDRGAYKEIAQIVGEEIGWMHPRFLPDDPLEVVFWAYQDGLDGTAATMRLEQNFGIKLSDEECGLLRHARMSDLVQSIKNMRANQPLQRNASTMSFSTTESPIRRG